MNEQLDLFYSNITYGGKLDTFYYDYVQDWEGLLPNESYYTSTSGFTLSRDTLNRLENDKGLVYCLLKYRNRQRFYLTKGKEFGIEEPKDLPKCTGCDNSQEEICEYRI